MNANSLLIEMLMRLAAENERLAKEREHFRGACRRIEHEITSLLGPAVFGPADPDAMLEPWGTHDSVALAMEAVSQIKSLEKELEATDNALGPLGRGRMSVAERAAKLMRSRDANHDLAQKTREELEEARVTIRHLNRRAQAAESRAIKAERLAARYEARLRGALDLLHSWRNWARTEANASADLMDGIIRGVLSMRLRESCEEGGGVTRDGFRAALWHVAVGAAVATWQACEYLDPVDCASWQIKSWHYNEIALTAVEALAELGDKRARELLETGLAVG